MRALELYAGIGGFAAAFADRGEVLLAIDQNPNARATYAHNFSHPTRDLNLAAVRAETLAQVEADLWWMSPPCQGHTRRGLRRDLEDPRSASLGPVMDAVAAVRPRAIALENVVGFFGSQARARVVATLEGAGYVVRERLLCPTELGQPNRRPRYYLVASRDDLPSWPEVRARPTKLAELLREDDEALWVPPEALHPYRHVVHVVEPDAPETHCFTAAYGRSWVFSGSYLRRARGVRRFSPAEVLAQLGFAEGYRFPDDQSLSGTWRLAGNSLSVPAVQEVLRILD